MAAMDRTGVNRRSTSGTSSMDGQKPEQKGQVEEVGLNKYTLQFDSSELEHGYQRSQFGRQRQIWQRSLLVSIVYQMAFYAADHVSGSPVLAMSRNIRIGLALMQMVFFLLMSLRLVHPHQRLVLLDSVFYGVVTVGLHVYQRQAFDHWDALFVQFGIAFYMLPKISPLQYLQATLGSGLIIVMYMWTVVFLRPLRLAEIVLTCVYLGPSCFLFNPLAYSTERVARERYVLQSRLSKANIQVAFSMREDGSTSEALNNEFGFPQTVAVPASQDRRRMLFRALLAWMVFNAANWASIPEKLRFVDQGMALAWLSHCAGFTLFLIAVTRQTRWLLVNFVLGLTTLYGLSLTIPDDWGTFAANSLGYALLVATVIMAFGAVSGVVFLWTELVAFVKGIVFHDRTAHQKLLQNHPALERIISAAREDESGTQQASSSSSSSSSSSAGGYRRGLPVASTTSQGPHGEQGEEQMCFFCQSHEATQLLPACGVWGHRKAWVEEEGEKNWHSEDEGAGGGEGGQESSTGEEARGEAAAEAGDAWLPTVVEHCDLATGTVLSSVVQSGENMCTPYASLHKHRTDLALQLRGLSRELRAERVEHTKQQAQQQRDVELRCAKYEAQLQAQATTIADLQSQLVQAKTVCKQLLSDLNAASGGAKKQKHKKHRS